MKGIEIHKNIFPLVDENDNISWLGPKELFLQQQEFRSREGFTLKSNKNGYILYYSTKEEAKNGISNSVAITMIINDKLTKTDLHDERGVLKKLQLEQRPQPENLFNKKNKNKNKRNGEIEIKENRL